MGLIKGVKLSGAIFLTHTPFVNDVMIFGRGDLDEWRTIKGLTDSFCSAFGMSFNPVKSYFRF